MATTYKYATVVTDDDGSISTGYSEGPEPTNLGSNNLVGQGLHLKLAAKQNATIVILSDSTADAAGEWADLLGQYFAGLYAGLRVETATWASTDYPAVTVLQAGDGASGTLSVWNCSVASQASQFFLAPYFDQMLAIKSPDLTFVSLGHNEGSAAAEPFWRDNLSALTETVTAACPQTELVLLTQNPRTDGNAAVQAARRHVTMRLARQRGYGLIDTFRLFVLADNTTDTSLLADQIHPNPAGQRAIFNEIKSHLRYVPGSPPNGQQVSTLLLPTSSPGFTNMDFASYAAPPTGWTGSNVTVTQNTTEYEAPHGHSIRTVPTTAAIAYLQNSATGANIRSYLGSWATLCARERVVAGSPANAGRISIFTTGGSNTASQTSTATTQGQGDWRWATASIRVDRTAGTLTIRLFAENGATGTGDVSWDRVVVARGLLPRDLR